MKNLWRRKLEEKVRREYPGPSCRGKFEAGDTFGFRCEVWQIDNMGNRIEGWLSRVGGETVAVAGGLIKGCRSRGFKPT